MLSQMWCKILIYNSLLHVYYHKDSYENNGYSFAYIFRPTTFGKCTVWMLWGLMCLTPLTRLSSWGQSTTCTPRSYRTSRRLGMRDRLPYKCRLYPWCYMWVPTNNSWLNHKFVIEEQKEPLRTKVT